MKATVIRGPLPKTIQPTSSFTPTADVGVSVKQYGFEQLKTMVFTLDALVDTLDEAGVGQYGSVDLGTLPAGRYLIQAASLDADLTLLAPYIDAANVEVGIGTTAIPDGGALAATEKNILARAAANSVVKVSDLDAGSAAGYYLNAAVDQHLYLNVRIADNALHAATADNPLVGTLTLVVVPLT